LKLKRYKDKEKKKIKSRFEAAVEKGDERLSVRDEKIFLNPSAFGYSDLLAKE